MRLENILPLLFIFECHFTPYIFIFVVMLEDSQFYIILLLLLYGLIYCYYNGSPEGIVVLFCNYYKWISLCSKCKWIQCSHPFLTSKFSVLEILILNFPLDILHHWIACEENSLNAAFSYHADWKMCFFFNYYYFYTWLWIQLGNDTLIILFLCRHALTSFHHWKLLGRTLWLSWLFSLQLTKNLDFMEISVYLRKL